MPFPNEHTCRFLPPITGRAVRRETGAATIAGHEVDHVYQMQKDGKMGLQAVRFPRDNGWAEADATQAARDWCKTEGGRFEAMKSGGQAMATPAFTRIFTFPTEVKGFFDETAGRIVGGRVSSGQTDRQNERVHQAALLRAYERRGVMPYLFQHNQERPIGTLTEYGMEGESVVTKASLFDQGKSEFADLIWTCVTHQPAVPISQSIGFNPVDREDWTSSGDKVDGIWTWGGADGAKDIDLIETSACVIGANREADLHIAKALGLELEQPWVDDDLTQEEREEKRFVEDITRAAGGLEGADNIIRHWGKSGRAPSPEALELLLSPMSSLASILKAGRVLSASNRTAVTAAIDALQEVVARDDESRSRASAQDEAGKGKSIFDLPWPAASI